MIKQTFYFLTLLLFSISLHAGNASITPFVQGEEATSSEVNATLNALVTAINDNHSRLASLEGASVNNSVAGRSYQFFGLEEAFLGDGELSIATPITRTNTVTLNLSTDNSFTLNTVSDSAVIAAEGSILQGPSGSVIRLDDNASISDGGSWSQNGETVTLTFASQGARILHVLLDGRFIVSDSFAFGPDLLTGFQSITSLIIGVEIQ